jgi:hypothetical protein
LALCDDLWLTALFELMDGAVDERGGSAQRKALMPSSTGNAIRSYGQVENRDSFPTSYPGLRAFAMNLIEAPLVHELQKILVFGAQTRIPLVYPGVVFFFFLGL